MAESKAKIILELENFEAVKQQLAQLQKGIGELASPMPSGARTRHITGLQGQGFNIQNLLEQNKETTQNLFERNQELVDKLRDSHDYRVSQKDAGMHFTGARGLGGRSRERQTHSGQRNQERQDYFQEKQENFNAYFQAKQERMDEYFKAKQESMAGRIRSTYYRPTSQIPQAIGQMGGQFLSNNAVGMVGVGLGALTRTATGALVGATKGAKFGVIGAKVGAAIGGAIGVGSILADKIAAPAEEFLLQTVGSGLFKQVTSGSYEDFYNYVNIIGPEQLGAPTSEILKGLQTYTQSGGFSFDRNRTTNRTTLAQFNRNWKEAGEFYKLHGTPISTTLRLMGVLSENQSTVTREHSLYNNLLQVSRMVHNFGQGGMANIAIPFVTDQARLMSLEGIRIEPENPDNYNLNLAGIQTLMNQLGDTNIGGLSGLGATNLTQKVVNAGRSASKLRTGMDTLLYALAKSTMPSGTSVLDVRKNLEANPTQVIKNLIRRYLDSGTSKDAISLILTEFGYNAHQSDALIKVVQNDTLKQKSKSLITGKWVARGDDSIINEPTPEDEELFDAVKHASSLFLKRFSEGTRKNVTSKTKKAMNEFLIGDLQEKGYGASLSREEELRESLSLIFPSLKTLSRQEEIERIEKALQRPDLPKDIREKLQESKSILENESSTETEIKENTKETADILGRIEKTLEVLDTAKMFDDMYKKSIPGVTESAD